MQSYLRRPIEQYELFENRFRSRNLRLLIDQYELFESHVRSRNLREMLRMVELGHDVNMAKPWKYFNGEPLLVNLVDRKDWTLVLFLLEHRKRLNIDPNARSNTGYCWTSMHYAVAFAHLQAVDALIENGADVNCKSRGQNWSPLEVLFNARPEGIFNRQEAVFCRLISGGADISDPALQKYALPLTWSEKLKMQISGCVQLRAILKELFEEIYLSKLVVEFVYSKTIREM